jgi:hypothetical protein
MYNVLTIDFHCLIDYVGALDCLFAGPGCFDRDIAIQEGAS